MAILAQSVAAAGGGSFWEFLSGIPWWSWIPIIAIVMGGIQQIVKMGYKHQERLAMIRQGMDPNQTRRE